MVRYVGSIFEPIDKVAWNVWLVLEEKMSYSVFRVEGVKNTSSLKGLCKHNKDRISNTNPDIDKDKSKDNIVLVECDGTYNKKFNEITKEMRIQHDERMKTMRADRVKSFDRSLDDSSSDVACEMLFTSDEKFFENMNKDQIRQWAQESLNFVTKDIGIKKENIIHAVVHMDEKTPHLHVVAVPLIDTYDKRRKQNTLKISRAKYIQGGKHLTKLQDVYNERMNACGYKLDRGDIGNLKVHEKTADYKARQVKEHIKILDIKKAQLNSSIKEIDNKYSNLLDDKCDIYYVDNIQAKKSIVGQNITIKEEDFNRLKGIAIEGLKNKTKITDLEKENRILKSSNARKEESINRFHDENVKLKQSNKKLTNELEKSGITNKALYTVAKENDLLGQAQKILEELVKPKNKTRSKQRDWDRDR